MFWLVVIVVMGMALSLAVRSFVGDQSWWDFPLSILCSLLLLGLIFFSIGQMGGSPMSTMIGMLMSFIFMIMLVGLWWSPLIDLLGETFGIFTGGNRRIEERPIYSPVEALTKRGKYQEALEELERQLSVFPGDVEGTLLLMDLHARHMGETGPAREAVEEWLTDESRSPSAIFRVLAHMADLHLRLDRDRESAAACLERARSLCSGTREEALATQKLAHLGTGEFVRTKKKTARIELREFDRRLGLRQSTPAEEEPEHSGTDDEELAAWLRQLEEHPRDWEARERLAQLYARRQAPDLALEQLEFLLRLPNQPVRKRVQWYHRMADVHMVSGGGAEAARKCLERVVGLCPGTFHQVQAEKRIRLLGRESRGRSG